MVLATAVREQKFTSLGRDLADAYRRISDQLTWRERVSWITTAAPNVAVAIAVLLAAAVPTFSVSTFASEYLDLVSVGWLVAALGVATALVNEQRESRLCLSLVLGLAVAFSGVALLLLGWAGALDVVLRDDLPRSVWLAAPVLTYLLVGSELLRRPEGTSASSSVMLELAQGTAAVVLGVFAIRLVLAAPVVNNVASGNVVIFALGTIILMVVGSSLLMGAIGYAWQRLGLENQVDRRLIVLGAACLSVIIALVANFV